MKKNSRGNPGVFLFIIFVSPTYYHELFLPSFFVYIICCKARFFVLLFFSDIEKVFVMKNNLMFELRERGFINQCSNMDAVADFFVENTEFLAIMI